MLSILDRLIVIDGGKILADGPRDEVLKHLTAAPPLRQAAGSEGAAIVSVARSHRPPLHLRFAGLRIEALAFVALATGRRWRDPGQPAPRARRGQCVDRDPADRPGQGGALIEATTGDAANADAGGRRPGAS